MNAFINNLTTDNILYYIASDFNSVTLVNNEGKEVCYKLSTYFEDDILELTVSINDNVYSTTNDKEHTVIIAFFDKLFNQASTYFEVRDLVNAKKDAEIFA